MDDAARNQRSKFLSRVLRHRPQQLGLELGPGGWVSVGRLLEAAAMRGRCVSRSDIEAVAANCDKQRFAFGRCGERIRASQGHSVTVDLGYEAVTPPTTLFHGTTRSRLGSIRSEGLRRMRRHHVHLSEDADLAARVATDTGQRLCWSSARPKCIARGTIFSCRRIACGLPSTLPRFLDVPDQS